MPTISRLEPYRVPAAFLRDFSGWGWMPRYIFAHLSSRRDKGSRRFFAVFESCEGKRLKNQDEGLSTIKTNFGGNK
ncbi:hypothetical protein [Paenibacillus sp. NFR01]|uniref:hypothetical protein n=1 Tax=Paenibacillus sp. NFR01 TaxID=1566279 RepID=UPI001113AAD0|nr:hypothetical protein [Paenibacillus sp. NFR01]